MFKFGKKSRLWLSAVFLIGVLASVGWRFFQTLPKRQSARVIIPVFSAGAQKGRFSFITNCGRCHGKDASGTDLGPPLIHRLYHPGHHADLSFFRAVRFGVIGHHWTFGNMPSQPHVTDDEIAAITRFIREVQQANGIF